MRTDLVAIICFPVNLPLKDILSLNEVQIPFVIWFARQWNISLVGFNKTRDLFVSLEVV